MHRISHSTTSQRPVQSSLRPNCTGRFALEVSLSGLFSRPYAPVMSVVLPTSPTQTGPLLYEQVCEHISGLIEKGSLRPGERVPSVRRLSAQSGVSISTVIQAYRVLENRGLLEARPQSGYYVRPRRWNPPPEPELCLREPAVADVHVGDLIMQVVRDYEMPSLIRLGATCATVGLHSPPALHRALSAVARRAAQRGVEADRLGGSAAFRSQVARHAVAAGCTLSPTEILGTSGATESVHLCLRAICQPGDLVAIESPTFFGFLQLIESLGLRAVEIPTYPRDGVCLDALAYALEHQPIKACLFVLNFNNPLGACMPDDKKERLVALLAEHQVPLIENDIYGALHFGPVRPRVAKSYDRHGLVLLCDSFNKILAPGYRVGWVAPGRFQARVEYLKFITTDASASLAQMAIAEFLANGSYEHHLRKLRRFYAEGVRRMTEAVVRYFPSGTRATRPSGGQVLWVELPASIDALALYREAMQHRIAIAPGSIFSPKQKCRNFIRLNCGNPWSDTIEDAVRLLGELATRRMA